jgi:hypothetical protein
MQYRIQGSRMLTGGKSLFLNLPDKLQEVRSTVVASSFSLSEALSEHEADRTVSCPSICI